MFRKKAPPSTGLSLVDIKKTTNILPSLDQFVPSIVNGHNDAVVGIFIPGIIALPVSQQPTGNANFVTREPNQVTQFDLAGHYGTVGILAHNDLAGSEFPEIKIAEYAVVIYGDGHKEYYLIEDIQKYQALSPNSAFSDFINLDGSNEHLNAAQLFARIYSACNRLVLQTCIEANGNASWGRIFIIGKLINDPYHFPSQPDYSGFLSLLQSPQPHHLAAVG